MNIFKSLIFSLHLLFYTTICATPNLTPSNTIIISDVDDVIIEDSFMLLCIVKMRELFENSRKKVRQLQKTSTEKHATLHGLPFYILNLGMRKPYIAPYVSWIMDYLGQSSHFIQGTEKIYRYLRDIKGYSIVFATNQDAVLYDITSHSLGAAFTSLADKVFVSQQKNSPQALAPLQAFSQLPTTPLSYKTLLHKALIIQPTDIIFHVPSKKPAYEYYQYVAEKLGEDKNMIFIDDKISNVNGFEALQHDAPAARIGIQFKNPQQLADAFVALNILSEIDDRQFLQEIRYPGWWGKIKLLTQGIIFSSKTIDVQTYPHQKTEK